MPASSFIRMSIPSFLQASHKMESRRVGVLGGGQLGRMMAEAGHRLGIQLAILDPAGTDSPAGQVASLSIEGSFRDEEKVKELAQVSDILTVEIEHVNCDALEAIMATGVPVQPLPATVKVIQDKYLQKVYLAKHGIPLPEFSDVPTLLHAYEAGKKFGYPLMLKSRKLAYDGKGNAVAKTESDVAEAFQKLGEGEVYAEKWAPFSKELAVMVVRSNSKGVRPYPVVETVQKDNICHITITPAPISGSAYAKALEVASQAISVLEGAGIFGVELFLMPDDTILLNEIAPRPHNSGHYTMEACETDQFENHLRAILDLPLGGTDLRVGAAVMLNILGEGNTEETKALMAKALEIPGAGLHWYGKGEAKKGRKMAHITFTGHTLYDIKQRTTEYKLLDNIPLGPEVGIIMGSDSDLPCMKDAAEILEQFGVKYELTIVSAHRTPTRMYEYAQSAARRGVQVIIAGAGGAAHLPGMVAALTPLPVIGVPVKTSTLSGVDSLYSIVQMPKGIPVSTVAIGNAANAGLLAVRIIASARPDLLNKMDAWMRKQEGTVLEKAEKLETGGWREYLGTK